MGFREAIDVVVGDWITAGGRPRRVVQVVRAGRSWPYFQLESDAPTALNVGEVEAGVSPDWRSWMTCGRRVIDSRANDPQPNQMAY